SPPRDGLLLLRRAGSSGAEAIVPLSFPPPLQAQGAGCSSHRADFATGYPDLAPKFSLLLLFERLPAQPVGLLQRARSRRSRRAADQLTEDKVVGRRFLAVYRVRPLPQRGGWRWGGGGGRPGQAK